MVSITVRIITLASARDRRMATPVRIIGSYLSPYVRKVLVFLHLKGINYEIDPIVAFMGDDRFSRLSPVADIAIACFFRNAQLVRYAVDPSRWPLTADFVTR